MIWALDVKATQAANIKKEMEKDSSKTYAIFILLIVLFFLVSLTGVYETIAKTRIGNIAMFFVTMLFGAIPALGLIQGVFYEKLNKSRDERKLIIINTLMHLKRWVTFKK